MSLPNVSYGFIGIGVMGYPMAQNLRRAIPESSDLVICEVNKTALEKFVAETEGHIKVANTPAEVAQQCDIIITMLPKGPHVDEVFTGQDGLLSTDRSGILFMECSTIDVATSNRVCELATKAGHRFVDAPVSGGHNGAVAGTLTIMIGGSEELFEEVRPLAEVMGKKENIYHCGKQGSGLATKQINNYLGFVGMLGTCEAFNMGRLYGLDLKKLASVINVSTGHCYNSDQMNPVKGITKGATAEKDFEGGFSTELCKGVVEMALQLGEQVGARSVLRDVVLSVLDEVSQSEKCKGKDYRSIYLQLAGIEQHENHA